MCRFCAFARTLIYSQIQRYYTSNQSLKTLKRRLQKQPVPSYKQVFATDSQDEFFYLRLLLVIVFGTTSFQHFRTVWDR